MRTQHTYSIGETSAMTGISLRQLRDTYKMMIRLVDAMYEMGLVPRRSFLQGPTHHFTVSLSVVDDHQ